jgi:two-component system response regulator PilR (NtrC family)
MGKGILIFRPALLKLRPKEVWLNYCTDIGMETKEHFSVLIVDDDEDICFILKAGLQSRFSTYYTHSLAEAQRYLTNHKVSLLFLDNSLPDGQGIGFIKKAINLDPGVKVIMMTADASAAVRDEAFKQGAVCFIPKPFELAVVKNMLLSILPGLSAA